MADRRHGIPPPPTTSRFDAAVWGDTPLSGTQHVAVLFADVDLSDVLERGASFIDCTFREVRFGGSSHIDAAFTNCTFVECSFFDTRFTIRRTFSVLKSGPRLAMICVAFRTLGTMSCVTRRSWSA